MGFFFVSRRRNEMTLEKIVTPKVEITLFGKKYNCEMKIRNYAVLRERTGVREHELLKGLMDGDIKFIVYAIWASTLIFAKFDETEPINGKTFQTFTARIERVRQSSCTSNSSIFA